VLIPLVAKDAEKQALTFQVISPPSHGLVCTKGDARATYTPDADFAGEDVFHFVASDGSKTSLPAAIQVTVTPVNDRPTAQDTEVETAKNKTVSIELDGLDPDGDKLRFELTSQPAHGALVGDPPLLSYRPTKNYVGSDEFSYRVVDPSGEKTAATVTVTVGKK
jgi:hypothetical protein